ncbi:MAG: hypothetical protein M3P33_01265 [bacterium]|nr:hypothetical protein [bacterium]
MKPHNKFRSIFVLLALFIATSNSVITAYASIASYDLKPASNTYKSTGTISLDKDALNVYSVSAVVKNLPSSLPGNGVYYIFWALQTDGKANNLGPITNDSQITKTLPTKVSQFFITSEKERYPEYVNGPRIAQTDTIPESIYSNLVTPAPVASSSALLSPRPTSFTTPVGAPETGLGGGLLFQIITVSIGALGASGLTYSLAKKFAK